MNQISISHFLEASKEEIQVIDVREKYEHESGSIESINIPMDKILESIHKIQKDKKVIIYCQTGRRAAAVAYMLKKEHKLNNIFNILPEWEFKAENATGESILNDPNQVKSQSNLITFNQRYSQMTYDGYHFSQLGTLFNFSINYKF